MQTRNSPSENIWSPKKTRNFLGKNKIPNRPPTDERVDISNPATRAETSEKIGRRKKLSSFCGKDSERKFAQPTTSESPQKNRTSKIERGTLKNRVVSSIFLQKAKVFEINRVKKNQREEASRSRGRV